mgnify:FL=1
MKYEMINEELRIARCSLADLTLEQVKHFLGQWEPGSNIGNLILFYEKEDDVIVLNSSNKKYQVWLDIVAAYLIATGEDKEKLQEMMFKYSEDAAKILDNCLNYRACKQDLFRVKQTAIPEKYSGMLWQIWEDTGEERGAFIALYYAFAYGMMCGKRLERAKKHR